MGVVRGERAECPICRREANRQWPTGAGGCGQAHAVDGEGKARRGWERRPLEREDGRAGTAPSVSVPKLHSVCLSIFDQMRRFQIRLLTRSCREDERTTVTFKALHTVCCLLAFLPQGRTDSAQCPGAAAPAQLCPLLSTSRGHCKPGAPDALAPFPAQPLSSTSVSSSSAGCPPRHMPEQRHARGLAHAGAQ